MSSIKKRFLSVLLLSALLLPALPTLANEAVIELKDIEDDSFGPGWEYVQGDDPIVTIIENGSYRIKATGTSEAAPSAVCIVVARNVVATITIENLHIKAGVPFRPPLLLETGAEVTLHLVGENSLVAEAGTFAAGIQNTGASLTITAESESCSLTAKGGNNSAGIGGKGNGNGPDSAGGTVTIYGGTVHATGGNQGAGIGGGNQGAGGIITIYGGTVHATGVGTGAGIGGGEGGASGVITIYDGTIHAISDMPLPPISAAGGGAGIGGGGGEGDSDGGDGERITIHGGTVYAQGSFGGAGIGGGRGGDSGTITIQPGAAVTATGGDGVHNGKFYFGAGAAIGGGGGRSDNDTAGEITGEISLPWNWERSSSINLTAGKGLFKDGAQKSGSGARVGGGGGTVNEDVIIDVTTLNGKEFTGIILIPAPGFFPPFFVTTQMTYRADTNVSMYTNGNLVITSNGPFSRFTGLKCDGARLTEGAHYSVAAGSTVVTVYESYMQTLPDGAHTFTLLFDNGQASVSVNVQKQGAVAVPEDVVIDPPKTGDAPSAWPNLMMLCLAAALLAITRRRRA